ncbi:unnamed protein product [Cunninghamella blakesleeana]
MSKVKTKYENLIPLPIQLNTSTHWYDILSNYLFPNSTKRSIGIYIPFGKCVWIQQYDNLFNHGCFGKGTLSRSEPTWYKRLKYLTSVAPEQKTKTGKDEKKNNALSNDILAESLVVNNEDVLTQKEILEWAQEMDFEKFHLDLFEAFFLMYAINVIEIQDKLYNIPYTIEECWTIFSKDYSSNGLSYNAFALKYAVYHYFRSQGWVPKDGLKFGVDFVLYKAGPIYHHAEFAIHIIPCPTLTSSYTLPIEQQKQHQSPEYNWSNLLRLNRVCNQVKKTLLLCYVSYPVLNNSDHKNTWDISILNQISIKQVLLKRWSPEKNRD